MMTGEDYFYISSRFVRDVARLEATSAVWCRPRAEGPEEEVQVTEQATRCGETLRHHGDDGSGHPAAARRPRHRPRSRWASPTSPSSPTSPRPSPTRSGRDSPSTRPRTASPTCARRSPTGWRRRSACAGRRGRSSPPPAPSRRSTTPAWPCSTTATRPSSPTRTGSATRRWSSCRGRPVELVLRQEDGWAPRLEDSGEGLLAAHARLPLLQPSNPTGAVWSAETMRAITRVLEKFPRVVILSDESTTGWSTRERRRPTSCRSLLT